MFLFTFRKQIVFLFYFFKFILREREHASMSWVGAEREGAEIMPSRLHTISAEPDMGLELTNCEIMT